MNFATFFEIMKSFEKHMGKIAVQSLNANLMLLKYHEYSCVIIGFVAMNCNVKLKALNEKYPPIRNV